MTSTDFGDPTPADLAFALQRTLRRRAALGTRRVPQPGPERATVPPAAQPTAGPDKPQPPLRPEPQVERPRASQTETYSPPRPAPGPPARVQPPLEATQPGRPAALGPGCSSLADLRAGVENCRACALAESRTQTVFGDGLGTRRILFVGEAPGAEEDRTGTPFVGPAGQLLTDIITKGMGLRREEVYIANVLKCRPPGNRDPLPEEKELCTGWLDRQIELVDPLVIIPLGRHAACHVLGVDAPLGRLRGRVHDRAGRKVVPTYHPAYLLRSPHEKKKTWEDIQLAMVAAQIPLPDSP